MTAAAYVRVSSKAQDLATQRSAIARAAEVRGDAIGETYAEKVSGRSIDRPELNRLRADARAGKVRRLYVFRIDRLARSGIRDVFEVVEELRRCGVEIVSVADGFSLDGPAADVVLAVMAWAAQMERSAIGERISAARERLRREGKAWGRPPRMSAEQRAQAAAMKAAGRSVRQIAVALKVPRATVARALKA